MISRVARALLVVACAGFWGAVARGSSDPGAAPPDSTAGAASHASGGAEAAAPSPGQIQAEPPPFTDGIFPCSDCHTEPGNPERRTLDMHDDIQGMFDHDSENRWCLDCHDLQNRDVLRLASGAPVPFSESYRLCGQCHGDKYRDWRAGVHGKRVGEWNGQKTYFLCVHCHNPHSPAFMPVKPEPAPLRPEEMRR